MRQTLIGTAIALAVGATVALAIGQRADPPPPGGGPLETRTIPTDGAVEVIAEVWADNWFALYLSDALLAEDSVPITTERSFNAERIAFRADYPMTLNFVVMDYRENDTGLEYIGTNRQQMGDGGFIAQFRDTATGEAIAVTDDAWRCLVVHDAPGDRSCERDRNATPGEGACTFESLAEPAGWRSPDFDDSSWPQATVHGASAVDPKDGYDQVDWLPQAELIWGPDLETNNTLLCRLTVGG